MEITNKKFTTDIEKTPIKLEENIEIKRDEQSQKSISDKLLETTWENYVIGALSAAQYLTRAVSDIYYGRHVYDILKSIGTAVLFNKTIEKFEDLLKPLKSQEGELKENLNKFSKLGNDDKNSSINCDIDNSFNTSNSSIENSTGQNMTIGNKTISISNQPNIGCINPIDAVDLGIMSKEDAHWYSALDFICFTDEKVRLLTPTSYEFYNNTESLNKTEEMFLKFKEVQNQKKEFLEQNFKNEKEFSGFIDSVSKQCMESKEVISDLTKEVNDFFNATKSVPDEIGNSTKKLENLQSKQKDTVGKTSETREKNAPTVNNVLYWSTAINIMLMAGIHTLNQHKIKKALPNEVKDQNSFAKDVGKGLLTGAGLTALNHVSHILSKAILDYGFSYMSNEFEDRLGINKSNENYKVAQETFSTIILPLVVYNCTIKYGLPLCAEAYKYFSGLSSGESEKIESKLQEDSSKLQKDIKKNVDDKIHAHNTLDGVKEGAKVAKNLWNGIICCPRRKKNHIKFDDLKLPEKVGAELSSIPSQIIHQTESKNLVKEEDKKKEKSCIIF